MRYENNLYFKAINHIGISIMSEAEEKSLDKNKIMMLSGVIADLAELAINK
jgi:hypothetical protein